MKIRPANAVLGIACLLFIVVVFAALAGCADPSSEDATTSSETATASSTSPSTASTATSTTTPPVTLSPYQKELARTANVQNVLVQMLTAQNVAQDDPRMALILGLRARTLALSCRQALAEGDLDLASQAMTDVYATLNTGRNLAEAPVAQVLTDAHAAIETLGDPSEDPERAAALLDEFIATLASLLDQAESMTAAAATT